MLVLITVLYENNKMLNGEQKKAAIVDAFERLDPNSIGIYLFDVAHEVAQTDEAFMKRQAFYDRIRKFLGRDTSEPRYGHKYYPRIFVEVAELEKEGVVDSFWTEHPSRSHDRPRRRIYRYLGGRANQGIQEA